MQTLKESDFPENLKEDWVWIHNEITKRGPLLEPNGEDWLGSVENTMQSISNITGQQIAQRISKLYWEISNNENIFLKDSKLQRATSYCQFDIR